MSKTCIFKALDLREHFIEIPAISEAQPHDQRLLFGVILLFRDSDQTRICDAIRDSRLEMGQLFEVLYLAEFHKLTYMNALTNQASQSASFDSGFVTDQLTRAFRLASAMFGHKLMLYQDVFEILWLIPE